MAEMAHILVIDDDARLRELLRRFLEESGYMVTDAENALQARAYMDSTQFDLLVIDVMMPGETGIEFLQSLRKYNAVPALFLTALSETENRIDGLSIGADDYISKPFEPRELILRIKNILDRSAFSSIRTAEVKFGAFCYQPESKILTEQGRRVHITTAEQELLDCFALHPNQTLSRDDISQMLGGRMNGRSIDVAVARLRSKLERDPRYPVFLQTIRGAGWQLTTNS